MKDKLCNLIDLKSIITIIICIAMVWFTAIGVIGNEMFIAVGTSIFTYFFTKKKEVDANGENKSTDLSSTQENN